MKLWSCCNLFNFRTSISTSLIWTKGNWIKSVYKGNCTELPTSASDGLFVPTCTANLLVWEKWLILWLLKRGQYQLKWYCNRALLLWTGWGLNSASFSSHWSAKAGSGGDLVCPNMSGQNGHPKKGTQVVWNALWGCLCPLPLLTPGQGWVKQPSRCISWMKLQLQRGSTLASTIPCPQLPHPDSFDSSGTGLAPCRTSSAHKTSSKWVVFSPLGSFEAIGMSWDETGEVRGTGHRWELAHPSYFSKSLLWLQLCQKPSSFRLVN